MKIDIDKFVASLIRMMPNEMVLKAEVECALRDQGLMYKDGEIQDLKGIDKFVCSMTSAEESLGISSEEYNRIVNKCIFDGTDQDGGVKGEKGEQGMTEFEIQLMEYMYHPNTDTAIIKACSKRLLDIARKQLEANPEFLYTVTRKAAEKARKHFLDKACEWLDENFLLYWSQVDGDNTDRFIRLFKKYMEEQR